MTTGAGLSSSLSRRGLTRHSFGGAAKFPSEEFCLVLGPALEISVFRGRGLGMPLQRNALPPAAGLMRPRRTASGMLSAGKNYKAGAITVDKRMIKTLTLNNFKGFSNHTIPFCELSIIVGKNNAGKSTIVEALQLISLITNRYKKLTYVDIPAWLDLEVANRGVSPSLRGIEIGFRNIFHQYAKPPAIIQCDFENGSKINLYINSDAEIYATIFNARGDLVSSQSIASRSDIPNIRILPQVAPLAIDEQILTPEYVQKARGSTLAPSHFRNQLNLSYDLFPEFKSMAERSWPELQILELEGRGGLPGRDTLFLHVRDRGFVAEVSSMGHGLQMWLQIIWFLTYAKQNEIVVLDEPDVYMHADLQRRVIRMIRGRFKQILVATHSVEIMSEVSPENILIVDRDRPQSAYSTSLPAVQRIINNVGSTHNIHLARLWSSKKLLLVEGNDIYYLKHFQNILFPNSQVPIDSIPCMPYGGWGGWSNAIGSSMLLKNSGGEEIINYCAMDSDYETSESITKRYEEARQRNIELIVWSKKEIENYLLVPHVIARHINSRLRVIGATPITDLQVNEMCSKIADEYKDAIMDLFAQKILDKTKVGLPKANMLARTRISEAWKTLDGKMSIVPGKECLQKISDQCGGRVGIRFNAGSLFTELKATEIHQDIRNFLSAVESGTKITLGNIPDQVRNEVLGTR